MSEIRTRQGPIEPPEGYEDWSMEPLPFVPSGERHNPKLESDDGKSVEKIPEERESIKEEVENENIRSFSWLYWILAVLILGGLAKLVLNNRKDSSAR